MGTLGTSIDALLASATQKARDLRDSLALGMHSKPRQIVLDDELVCLTNTAYRRNGQWAAEFVISVFDRHDELKAHAFEEVLMRLLRVNRGDLIWDRIQYFVAVPRENVNVLLQHTTGHHRFEVGPTRSNGIMDPQVVLPSEFSRLSQGAVANFEVITPPGYPGRHVVNTIFSEDSDFGVISGIRFYVVLMKDIDDTIKISQVLNRIDLLRNTFLVPEGQPVEGMPDLYQSLSFRLRNPTWFYLSASPWQLYPFLRQFTSKFYPFGQIILRDMSFVEISSFLSSLTIGTQAFKSDRIEKIHGWFPNKRFLCIGDSTQRDPETYGAMYAQSETN